MIKWLFRLLPRFLDTVPPGELGGAVLDTSLSHWEIGCPKKGSLPEFLEALESLLPEGSILCLEGGYPPRKDEVLLKSMSVPEQAHVDMSTSWPRPKVLHIPATRENLRDLARLAQHCAFPEIAIHIHAYQGNQVLLQWHGAFDNPIELAREIPEGKVKDFCNTLEIEYQLAGESETNPSENRI